MILIIDNYDSFTFNLVQMVCARTSDVRVVRNDELALTDAVALAPTGILISPGPGRPERAGICVDIICRLGPTVPILGVCLGHQAIGHAYGARIVHAPTLMHGKTSAIHHEADGIFRTLPDPFEATRYHSLVIRREDLPADLRVTAWTDDGTIMGVRHVGHPVEGVQFHPESVLTSAGSAMMDNWLTTCGAVR